MDLLSVIIPLLLLGAFWYLVLKVMRKAKDRVRHDPGSSIPRSLTPDPSPIAGVAPVKTFGRRVNSETASVDEPRQFVPAPNHFPLATYGMKELRAPHGYDVTAPESRTIPQRFRGDWLWEGASEDKPWHRVSLRAESLTYQDDQRVEPVVGAYTSTPGNLDEIAVVTQQMEDGQWLFATYLFKLLDGGEKLTNLESMDMRWNRLP